MKIHVFNKQKDLRLSKKQVTDAVKEVIFFEGHLCDEVSVNFINSKKMCLLHDQFFQDPSPTDCISFPMDDQAEDYRILGEIFVCPQVALEYAYQHKIDPYQETTLYVIHGLLHLMGYDDIMCTDRRKMRRAEAKHLKNLQDKHLLLSNEF